MRTAYLLTGDQHLAEASSVLELGARRVHILRITEHPTAAWASQLARNFFAEAGEQAHTSNLTSEPVAGY